MLEGKQLDMYLGAEGGGRIQGKDPQTTRGEEGSEHTQVMMDKAPFLPSLKLILACSATFPMRQEIPSLGGCKGNTGKAC